MSYNTEQMREYQRTRNRERLAIARERLGGTCVTCGSTEALDFDHIDPATKLRKVSEATNWSLARFLAEVDKCQLLCRDCHITKSIANGDLGFVEHGGGTQGRRGCKCEPCLERRRAYARLMKANRKAREAG